MRAKIVFHNEHHFRSITEARWAVFFEVLKIPYDYEKEIFKLEDGLYYLPDFWLPEQNIWVEIKGELPKEKEKYKAVKLYEITKQPVYILSGFPDVMAFSDPLGTSHHVNEICNFGTYVVNEKNPFECLPFKSGTANVTMMHMLGLYKPKLRVHEFRIITSNLNSAAKRGREFSFFWIDRPDDYP